MTYLLDIPWWIVLAVSMVMLSVCFALGIGRWFAFLRELRDQDDRDRWGNF